MRWGLSCSSRIQFTDFFFPGVTVLFFSRLVFGVLNDSTFFSCLHLLSAGSGIPPISPAEEAARSRVCSDSRSPSACLSLPSWKSPFSSWAAPYSLYLRSSWFLLSFLWGTEGLNRLRDRSLFFSSMEGWSFRSCFNDEREGGGQRGRGRPGMGDSLDQRSDLDGSEKRFRINRRPTRQQMMAGSPEKRKTHMSTQVKCSKTWDEGWEIHSSTLVWSGPCHVGSSQPGIKPVPAAVEAWSHKKARQVSTWVLWLYVTLQFSDPVS